MALPALDDYLGRYVCRIRELREALQILSYASTQVLKGWEAHRMWSSGRRGMGDNITIEDMAQYTSLTCWNRVRRALEKADEILTKIHEEEEKK